MVVKRVYQKAIGMVNETAIQIYENYVGDEDGFLLESYDKNSGRYVFLGKNPEYRLSSVGSKGLEIKEKGKENRIQYGNPILLLRQFFEQYEIKGECQFPFSGGLVGAFGYDYVKYNEQIPDSNPDEMDMETIELMLVFQFICMDLAAGTITAVCFEEDNQDGENRARTKLDQMLAVVESAKPQIPAKRIRDGIIVNRSDEETSYHRKVEKIKQYIRDGHIFQTVLSQRWTIETNQSGWNMYKELRVVNPSPYLYYFNYGDFEIIGSSPEMLVKENDGKIQTCPIAGTRRRGATSEEDERLSEDLLSDAKERAEHTMLVDLARNDMGRVSKFGTVRVPQFMKVQNYSHVMHLVSLVEGRKKDDVDGWDLLNSFLPAGTLSGAPKIRAMEIIDELEEYKRGLYGGSIGYMDFSGNIDFCITIRTMVKKGKKVYLQAGAGIVADSKPEMEYQECLNKVKALALLLVEEGKL